MLFITRGIKNLSLWFMYNMKIIRTFVAQSTTHTIMPIQKYDDSLLTYSTDGKTVTGVKDNHITSIIIPKGVEHIGIKAFSNCTTLKSIEIPDSVKGIGKHVLQPKPRPQRGNRQGFVPPGGRGPRLPCRGCQWLNHTAWPVAFRRPRCRDVGRTILWMPRSGSWRNQMIFHTVSPFHPTQHSHVWIVQ